MTTYAGVDMQAAKQWREQGFVLVREFLPQEQTQLFKEICEHALQQWLQNGSPDHEGGGNPAWFMRHINQPEFFRDRPEQLTKLLDLAADPRVLEIVRMMLGEEPIFYCTSLWFNPRTGNIDGDWHRDTQFLTKSDEEEQDMLFGRIPTTTGVQVQIALIASADVEIVPGSHRRWDTPEEYHVRKADHAAHARTEQMPGASRVALEPGDAVAFNPCIMHRGRYHADKPRRTLMLSYSRASVKPTHNFFTNQPWSLEPQYFRGVKPETETFLRRLIDACSPNWSKG